MAIETIKTRIKNKVDSIADWLSSPSILLDGEIAIVRVPTGDTYNNPVTGKDEPVIELLMKVGDGESTFANLPWLSAKASDVYDWAKTPDAKDVKVKIKKGTDSTATESALETWLKTVYDKGETNAATISELNDTVTKLDNADTVSGSIRNLIKVAIEDLDAKVELGSGNFVKAVTQVDGKIQVTKGTIAASDLPDISASKVKVDSSTTLDSKLSTMDAAIASKADAHNHDAYVNQNAFSNITIKKSGGGTSDVTVKADTTTDTVEFEGSNITITGTDSTGNTVDKITFSVADASGTVAGVVKLGATGGAATYDSVFGSDGKGGINKQVADNTSAIANLKTAVAGGVHFRGTVSAEPSESTTTVGNATIAAGDVVIYGGKEYICTAVTDGEPSWEQLGDVTRIGNLETKINSLDYTEVKDGAATNNKFVTSVTQTDGKIAATYARPSASNISYNNSNVGTKLDEIDAAIAAKADSGHTHSSYVNQNAFSIIKTSNGTVNADTTTDTVEFVGSNITITGADASTDKVTFAVADGSTSVKGIVQLNDTVTSTSTSQAATANAVKTAYDKAEAAAADAASRATGSHTHGNITNGGTITTTALTSVSGVGGVVVTDSNNKVTRMSPATVRTLIGAGTSNLAIGTSATTAAAGDHSHTEHEARTSVIEGNYVRFNSDDGKLYVGKTGVKEIIFDCGGAEAEAEAE